MTSERIKEIQQQTAYPDSVSVQQALLQVWNECSQPLEYNNNDDYFTHLQEELMDAILYIKKLKSIKYANR
jgi:hypothetical protein